MTAQARRLVRRPCLMGSVLLLFILLVAYQAWLPWVGIYLAPEDPPGAADAIILTYGVDRAKVAYAAYLYERGAAPKIVVCNFEVRVAGTNTDQSAELAERELLGRGVPQEAIVRVEALSSSTYDEAVNLRPVFQQMGISTAIVVAEPHRMRRTMLTFRAALAGMGITLLARPSPNPDYELSRWWTSRAGLDVVLNEYLRLVFYFLRGYFWGSPFAQGEVAGPGMDKAWLA